jgi:hypothetical protein
LLPLHHLHCAFLFPFIYLILLIFVSFCLFFYSYFPVCYSAAASSCFIFILYLLDIFYPILALLSSSFSSIIFILSPFIYLLPHFLLLLFLPLLCPSLLHPLHLPSSSSCSFLLSPFSFFSPYSFSPSFNSLSCTFFISLTSPFPFFSCCPLLVLSHVLVYSGYESDMQVSDLFHAASVLPSGEEHLISIA